MMRCPFCLGNAVKYISRAGKKGTAVSGESGAYFRKIATAYYAPG
jgi:hypothetical protein